MNFIYDGSNIPIAPAKKDPDSVVDYGVDWTLFLETDETILSSVWVLPADFASENQSNDDKKTAIFLSGGTLRKTYVLTNRIVTSAGRTEDRSMKITCAEK